MARGDKGNTSPLRRRENFPIWNCPLLDWPLPVTRQFPQGTLARRNVGVHSTQVTFLAFPGNANLTIGARRRKFEDQPAIQENGVPR
jgi:hypothetical protein